MIIYKLLLGTKSNLNSVSIFFYFKISFKSLVCILMIFFFFFFLLHFLKFIYKLVNKTLVLVIERLVIARKTYFENFMGKFLKH